jgi:hypothetical protein
VPVAPVSRQCRASVAPVSRQCRAGVAPVSPHRRLAVSNRRVAGASPGPTPRSRQFGQL